MRTFAVVLTTYLAVDVHDPDVIERVTGPNGDGWRAQMYDFDTAEDVATHLAQNFAYNGVADVSELDGWADIGSPTAVTFRVEDREADAEELR